MTRSTSRSTVLSVAGLVAAFTIVGGAGYAAGQITGQDIKDKTLGPNDLLDRVAYKTVDNDALVGLSGIHPVLTVTITAPTKGYLVVTWSSDNYSTGGQTAAWCAVYLDGLYAKGSRRAIQLDSSQGNGEEDCNTNVTIPVAAGKHKVVAMAATSDAAVVFDESTLTADFERYNGLGAAPTNAEIKAALEQLNKSGPGTNR